MITLLLGLSCNLEALPVDPEDVKSTPLGAARCPAWSKPAVAGDLSDQSLPEISGLVASRLHEDVLWAHQDSGRAVNLTALSVQGEVLATVALTNAIPLDWEDISAGEINGVPSLIVADIGDNHEHRQTVSIYVIAEPTEVTDAQVEAERFVLSFEQGSHDSEALWYDDGQVWLLTKRDTPTGLYSAPLLDGAVLRLQAEIPFGQSPLKGGLVTAADLNPAGDLLTVRTYSHAWAWRREADRTWPEVMSDRPCEVPVAEKPQGESITVDEYGDVFTISERLPLLYRSRRTVP